MYELVFWSHHLDDRNETHLDDRSETISCCVNLPPVLVEAVIMFGLKVPSLWNHLLWDE